MKTLRYDRENAACFVCIRGKFIHRGDGSGVLGDSVECSNPACNAIFPRFITFDLGLDMGNTE